MAASGGRPISRNCSCQLRAPMGCTAEDVGEALIDQFGERNVKGVQDFGQGRFQIYLVSTEVAAKVAERGLGLRGERVPVDRLSGGKIILYVKHAPFELENECIAAALSKYGKVHNIEHVFMTGRCKGLLSGERKVVLEPTSAVPSYIHVGRFNMLVHFRGQTKTCRLCDTAGHVAAECPEADGCKYCNRKGHAEAHCWAKEKDTETDTAAERVRTEEARAEETDKTDGKEPNDGKEDEILELESDNDTIASNTSFQEAPEEIREIIEIVSMEEEQGEIANQEGEKVISEAGSSKVKPGKQEKSQSTSKKGRSHADLNVVTRSKGTAMTSQVPSSGQTSRRSEEESAALQDEAYCSPLGEFPALPTKNTGTVVVKRTENTEKKKRKNKGSPGRQEKKQHTHSDEETHDFEMD